MPTDIDLDELDQLLVDGALLVEVLPQGEYDAEHLPDAISIPLRGLTAESVAHLDRARCEQRTPCEHVCTLPR
jgi:rhodanese-related sulfurtransferase